jgi:hypothetical protein
LSDTTYRFAFVEASVRDTVIIYKKDEVNFSYYSFKEHKQVEPEPEKTGYDLLFTSYYDLATLFGQTIPYQVGGTLLNIWQTSVAADTIHNYSDITYETISQLHFSRQRDIPGYRWKNVVVDITGGGSATYVVKTQYNYVIHTAQGNYFKMRFLSYTLDGRSGFPRFEFSRLE